MPQGNPIKNPYSHIMGMMRHQGSLDNPPTVTIATVLSLDPLTISVDKELQVDSDNIKIADYLLSGYQRQATISSADITNEPMQFTDGLKVNDELAVIPTADGQTYIIFCKVVSA